jgi:hypothetical protein
MTDCERLYTMRAFWFARAMDSPLPTFHSDLCMQTAKLPGRAWSTYIDEFGAIRASTMELFRHLSPEAWLRRGIASDYPFSVRAMAFITVGHVTHHMRILKERYL